MCEATFIIEISLFEWVMRLTHTHFIIPIVTTTVRVEYFSLIYYTLYSTFSLLGVAVFPLNTVTILGGSVILFF